MREWVTGWEWVHLCIQPGLVHDVAIIELGVSVPDRVSRANAERVARCSICVCMWRVCVCARAGLCMAYGGGGWVGGRGGVAV